MKSLRWWGAEMDIFLWCRDCDKGSFHAISVWLHSLLRLFTVHPALCSLPPTHVPCDSGQRQSAVVSVQEANCATGPFSMSIVCILQRKRTWLCPHCPSPSVHTRENLQAKLRQKVRLCYMTVSSALSPNRMSHRERLCEIAYVCRKR